MKKAITILGSILLIIGCFLPIMSIGENTLNFFSPIPANIPDVPPNALKYVAYILISIGVLVSAMAILNRSSYVWLSGVVAALIMTCVYFGLHAKLNEVKDQTNKQLDGLFGGLFKGVADSMFQTITIGGTAWYVIGTAAFLLILSTFIKTKNTFQS